MKLIIVTQKDYFFIPNNIEKIINRYGKDSVQLIIEIKSKGSINSKKSLFIRGFGLKQTLKYGTKVLSKKLQIILSITGFFKRSALSTSNVARKNKIQFKRVENINGFKILKELETINPDLIISFSAPVIFKKRLLNIPKLGCINLHCSFLPAYSGLFPSFWVLFKKEKFTGCTVHRMDDKIDNGEILKQEKILISPDDSIYSLLSRTKDLGGNLMSEVIEEIFEDTIKPIQNSNKEENYYTWPTIEELYMFRKNGGRLI